MNDEELLTTCWNAMTWLVNDVETRDALSRGETRGPTAGAAARNSPGQCKCSTT